MRNAGEIHQASGPALRVGYLRLSVTSRCGFSCTYCRPEDPAASVAATELSAGEIESLVRHLAGRHGLAKVRITGGEPTLRADLVEIVRRVARIPGIRDLGLTTNGLALARLAEPLSAAGLSRVNVSLDTLRPERFRRLTGRDGLPRVLEGIRAARAARLTPLKLNTVMVRGENEDELPDLVRFAADLDAEARFIELMPMGPLARGWEQRFVPAGEMRRRLGDHVRSWRPADRGRASATVSIATLPDGRAVRVGFITPMSDPFCDGCDRLRVAADGRVYACLMDRPAGSLLPALRPALDPGRVDVILADALSRKAPVHPACGCGEMTCIGG
jgi:cyclic pyranopterin phosphate synthase